MYATVFCVDEDAMPDFVRLTHTQKMVLFSFVRLVEWSGIDQELRSAVMADLGMTPSVLGKAEAALVRKGFFCRDGADRWVVNSNKIYAMKTSASLPRGDGEVVHGRDVAVAVVDRQMTIDDQIKAIDEAELYDTLKALSEVEVTGDDGTTVRHVPSGRG